MTKKGGKKDKILKTNRELDANCSSNPKIFSKISEEMGLIQAAIKHINNVINPIIYEKFLIFI